MKSRLASVRAQGGLDRVDGAVHLLEEEWRRHGEVRLENFWADQHRIGMIDPVDTLGLLAALVKADLRLRYDQGQTPTAGGYLQQFPELRGSESRVLSLVYEEFCLREERGGAPDVDSFCDQYPELESSLASQLRYHRLLSQAAGVNPSLPRFPEPGENFEEFHLLSDLGKGGTSRVFLAEDRSLGGKQVALKVTLDRGQEPKVQGALDHPHIVPVNAVIYSNKGRLCGLSMPFRPGLPLDEIIKRLKPAERPRQALAFWQVLNDEAAGGSGPPVQYRRRTIDRGGRLGPRGDGWEGFPVGGTYAQGAAWIVMIVARALHYAHGMRTFHRDVKPANVLLTLQNGPQLLDFNLAESPHSADRARAALHGGTPPYMAPEQIEAFLNPELWGKVAAQADIYSLGLVLRELLTGQMPELPNKRLSPSRELLDLLDRRPFLDVDVRRFNPSIPHSLAAIVAKCLALLLEDRYSSAESLARDLERFLKHQPLIDATNPSRRERMSNWVMRQRRVLTGAACIMLAVVLASGVVASGVVRSRPGSEQLEPSVESSPEFQSAVRAVQEAEYQRAHELLTQLVKDHPNDCLINLYLSLTLDRLAPDDKDKKEREAEKSLRAAHAAPDAENNRVAWAKDHPELVAYLVPFADARIQRVDLFAEKLDQEDPVKDEKRDQEVRWQTYELAAEALQLAEKLDPKSPKIQRLLAKTEEISCEYESAYDRLSRVIDSGASGSNDDPDMLFFCRKLRGRVAFLWVESQRDRADPLDDTVSMLEEAKSDLDFCDKFLSNHNFFLGERTFSEDHERKKYHVLHDKLRATVTLAEVEIELGHFPEADEHFQACKSINDKLMVQIEHMDQIEYAESSGRRVPDPAPLTDRMTAVSSWLRLLGFDGGPNSTISSNQSGTNAPHSG